LKIDDGVRGIGSGGLFAECAARALLDVEGISAQEIGIKSMNIAADKCIYTSKEFIHNTVDWAEKTLIHHQ
jgi:ATP-dependent HslUV protease subunit HslV